MPEEGLGLPIVKRQLLEGLETIFWWQNSRLKSGGVVWPQLAEALACMHQYGLIHRDIKAENIVFKDTATQAAAKGVPPIVKFIDLGMATLYNKDVHIQGTHIHFQINYIPDDLLRLAAH